MSPLIQRRRRWTRDWLRIASNAPRAHIALPVGHCLRRRLAVTTAIMLQPFLWPFTSHKNTRRGSQGRSVLAERAALWGLLSALCLGAAAAAPVGAGEPSRCNVGSLRIPAAKRLVRLNTVLSEVSVCSYDISRFCSDPAFGDSPDGYILKETCAGDSEALYPNGLRRPLAAASSNQAPGDYLRFPLEGPLERMAAKQTGRELKVELTERSLSFIHVTTARGFVGRERRARMSFVARYIVDDGSGIPRRGVVRIKGSGTAIGNWCSGRRTDTCMPPRG